MSHTAPRMDDDPRPVQQTFSLEESAAIICGRDDHGQIVAGGVQWLVKRLRSGELKGYKQARRWRMTAADIDAAIETLRPQRASVPEEVPALSGMTRTSRRRLAS